MILIDTSAWIEFLRDTGSSTCDSVGDLLSDEFAICEAVQMEVLSARTTRRTCGAFDGCSRRR